MKGIEAAFCGTLDRDAELRTSAKTGRAWLLLSVITGEEPDEQCVSVASFSASMAAEDSQLAKGASVYVEGKLKLRHWSGCDGVNRSSLSVVASLIQPLAQIGQRRPRKSRVTSRAKKVDPQAPLAFHDGTNSSQGDELPF